MSDLQKLKEKWNNNSDGYKVKEIGSGVHDFVSDVFQNPELFNLKIKAVKGGKNCFVHDTEAQTNGRPDFIIFLDDISIPVEVKCYTRLQEGEKQILRYQLDWSKECKYGILTDGYTWRFYNNTLYRELTLDKFIDNPQYFIDFWNDYINPENYYLSFFENKGQLSLFPDFDIINVEDNREMFFEDITNLIKRFKNKLDLGGYFKDFDKKERDKKATEISYAYFIQFILYKTLVDNAYIGFKQEFKDRLDSVYNSLVSKTYVGILAQISGMSNVISEKIYRPFNDEQKFIKEKIQTILEKPKQTINDVSLWLDIIIFIRKYNFANIKNDIFGFIYENYLKALYLDENKGQYFTDPAVVNFMLDEIGFTTEYIKNEYAQYRADKTKEMKISIVDPSCGSGTFLYSAVDRIINALDDNTENMSKVIESLINGNIFGLDIAEFPLYLAEMSILMRMLPLIVNQKYNNPIDKKIKVFKTKDSIAEFLDIGITADDVVEIKNEGQGDLFDSSSLNLGYKSFVRNEDDLREMKNSMIPPRRRFDFVIGNPPYVGLNKCYKDDVLFTQYMRIKNKDGSINQSKMLDMNNVYGINLHSIPGNPKKGRPNPNLYAFFIALGLALLKEDSTISYIIPQTILVDNDYDVLRYYLSNFTTIEKIITFGGKMFIGRGVKQNTPVATSSLIFVIKKKKPFKKHKIKIINYLPYAKDKGIDINIYLAEKNYNEKCLKQEDLQNSLTSWNFIKKDEQINNFLQQYLKLSDLSIYYDHKKSQLNNMSPFYFDGGYGIDESLVKSTPDKYMYPKVNNNFFNIIDIQGYWPDERCSQENYYIALRQGSQGYNLLDSPYKIIWSYANTQRFFFSDKPLIWARNQFNAIGSDNKDELLYLFGLLNSKVSKFVLNTVLKAENEDTLTIAIGIKNIKNVIRLPNLQNRNDLKTEIEKISREILELELKTFKDYVDLSFLSIQNFEKVYIQNDNLVLENNNHSYKAKIQKDKLSIVTKAIEAIFQNHDNISLSELKNSYCIDSVYQNNLKSYLDDLVFCAYFNINIKKIDFAYAEKIHSDCLKHKFYKLVNEFE